MVHFLLKVGFSEFFTLSLTYFFQQLIQVNSHSNKDFNRQLLEVCILIGLILKKIKAWTD